MRTALCLVLSFLATLCFAQQNYTIGTGGQSGTYYPFGGMLAKIWHQHIPGFQVRAEVTAASVENVIKVSANQQLAGIAMGDVVQKAFAGKKPFPRKLDIAVLLALYPNVVQFIVPANSDIKTISDLKGKRVSLGAPGSGTRVSAISLLHILGIEKSDLRAQSLNYAETADAIANGQIDAGVIVGSANVGTISSLALTRDIRILSFSQDEIDKISAVLPAYQAIDVAAGTYKNVPAFHAPAVWNVLVVNQHLDKKLAYQLTKTAFENMNKIEKVLKVAKYSTPQNIHRLAGVPLHPGAEAYLKEIGLS